MPVAVFSSTAALHCSHAANVRLEDEVEARLVLLQKPCCKRWHPTPQKARSLPSRAKKEPALVPIQRDGRNFLRQLNSETSSCILRKRVYHGFKCEIEILEVLVMFLGA